MVFFFFSNLLSKPQDRVCDLPSVQSEPQLKPTTQALSDPQEFSDVGDGSVFGGV